MATAHCIYWPGNMRHRNHVTCPKVTKLKWKPGHKLREPEFPIFFLLYFKSSLIVTGHFWKPMGINDLRSKRASHAWNWKSLAHTHIPPPPELPGPCRDCFPVVSCSAQSLDFTSSPRNDEEMRQLRSEPPRSNESSPDLITAKGEKRQHIQDFKQD